MQTKKYELNDNAYLTSYVCDDYRVDALPTAKPAIIICPGGGWMTLSEREGEPIAIEFAQRGYIAFVLHYCVSDVPAGPGDFGLVGRAVASTGYRYWDSLQEDSWYPYLRQSILNFLHVYSVIRFWILKRRSGL